MSDISFDMAGLASFLIAGLFAFALLVGIVILSVVIGLKRRAVTDPLPSKPSFDHRIGMFFSLLLNIAVMLFVIVFDGEREIDGAGEWLDRNFLIWESLTFVPWLLGIKSARRRD